MKYYTEYVYTKNVTYLKFKLNWSFSLLLAESSKPKLVISHYLRPILFIRNESVDPLSTQSGVELYNSVDIRMWGLLGPSYRLPTAGTKERYLIMSFMIPSGFL